METGAKEPEKQEESKRVREGIVSRQEVSTGPNAAQGSSEMGPAKLSVGFSSNEGIGDFVKNGWVERCGQKPDCSGLPGEVTFESGREWQVRNWSASCGPLIDGEEEPEGSSRRKKEGQRRAPPQWRRPGYLNGL